MWADEQAAEPEKADGVHTAGGDAQQDQQNLDCAPIVNRWRPKTSLTGPSGSLRERIVAPVAHNRERCCHEIPLLLVVTFDYARSPGSMIASSNSVASLG